MLFIFLGTNNHVILSKLKYVGHVYQR